MFERPKGGERAILVHIDLGEANEDFAEFHELAVGAGVAVVGEVTGARKIPEPKFFIGSGKAEEVRLAVEATQADVVLVSHSLSPTQERNLEQCVQCRILDRAGLILDIFARSNPSNDLE